MTTGISGRSESKPKARLKDHKPGRPRAIPLEAEPVIIELYRQGYGYRAISRQLRDEYHVSADFSSVKRVLKRLEIIKKNVSPPLLNQ